MDSERCQQMEVRLSLTEQAVAILGQKLDDTNKTLSSYSQARLRDLNLLREEITAIKLSLARWGGFCMALIAVGDILLFFFTGGANG